MVIRIAHCSDLHLLSLDGARALDFANKRWIGGLNLLANRSRHHRPELFEAMVADFNAGVADHVLVTGDITNLAFEQEFVYARTFFDSMKLGPEHTTVLPGNHDTYVAAGSEYFGDHFADFHTSDDGFEWDDGDPWPVVRTRGPLVIIGLSTSRQTPWFTAYGVIGDKQLARLERVLSDERLAGKLRLVAVHHPPVGRDAESRIRGLRDHRAFGEVLGRAGAELVLHGHAHRDLSHFIEGPDGQIPVRGIQSATYEAGKPLLRGRYRVYEVRVNGPGRPVLSSETLRVWHPEEGCFTDDEQPSAAASVAL